MSETTKFSISCFTREAWSASASFSCSMIPPARFWAMATLSGFSATTLAGRVWPNACVAISPATANTTARRVQLFNMSASSRLRSGLESALVCARPV
ncbi:MAG: hypothetical protein QM754_14200 [Tepidisphaeraceae bacterium]